MEEDNMTTVQTRGLKERKDRLKITAVTLANFFAVTSVIADDSWVRLLSGKSGVAKQGGTRTLTIAESAERLSEEEKRVVIGILLLAGIKLKGGAINGAELQDIEERKLNKVIRDGLVQLHGELVVVFPEIARIRGRRKAATPA